MADNTEKTPTPDRFRNPFGERVGALDHLSQRDLEGAVERESEEVGELGGAAGGLPGELDGGETDEAPVRGEEGHGEGAEAPLPEPDAFSAAIDDAKRKLKVGHSVDPDQFDDIAFDGRNFYDRGADNIWRLLAGGMVTSMLKVRGFSDRAAKGQTASPLDRAKHTILKHRRVDGAAPFLYHKNDIFVRGGRKFLNTSTVSIMEPASSVGAWGQHFPLIAQVYDNVFAKPIYRDLFLAWFKRFYESAEEGELAPGQALAMVGPIHCYKSWTIHKVLKPAMGGFADFSSMASGDAGGFTADVFESPLAVIDDARGASSEEKRNQYAAQIKKLVANPVHAYHKKFETPTEISWSGRVVLALNDDPFSIRLMPNLEISNADKMIAVYMKSWEDHPPSEVFKNIETTELPHFLAWLKAWNPPKEVLDERGRYGIRPIIAEEVQERIFQSSLAYSIQEKLAEWWARRPTSERKTPFVGTASAILDELGNCFRSSPEQMRGITHTILSARLRELVSRGDLGVEVVKRGPKSKKSLQFSIFLPWVEPKGDVTYDSTEKSVS